MKDRILHITPHSSPLRQFLDKEDLSAINDKWTEDELKPATKELHELLLAVSIFKHAKCKLRVIPENNKYRKHSLILEELLNNAIQKWDKAEEWERLLK